MNIESRGLSPTAGANIAPPSDASATTFREPWEAQAFALVVNLHQRAHFAWTDWSQRLADEIKQAQQRGDPDHGDTYYEHWLAALERWVEEAGLATEQELIEQRIRIEANAVPHAKLARRQPVAIG